MAGFKFEYHCETQTPKFELPLTDEGGLMDIEQEFNSSKFIEMPVKKFHCCAFCKNHNEIYPKKGHGCLYRHCPCILCDLTRKAQKAMRHQQQLWKYQKNLLRDCFDDPSFKIDSGIIDSKHRLTCQVCDKCRNHNHLTKKKLHSCPYVVCDCQFCSVTFIRKEIMKHQQSVRRLNITSKLIVEPSSPGSTSRESCGSPPLPALWSENLFDFNHLTSIMIKNEDIKDADIDAQRSFYSSEYFIDMENTITKTEYSIDEPMEDDSVYLKTVTNDSKANILDASLENRLSPPPLIPLLSYLDIKDEELYDSSENALHIDEASSHFNDSDDKSNRQHFQLYTEAHDSNSYNEFQLSPINIKNIMSFNGANAHEFSELFNQNSNCTCDNSANNIWDCYGCSPLKESKHDSHKYCLFPKSIIQQRIQMFKDTQNEVSSDFLYKC